MELFDHNGDIIRYISHDESTNKTIIKTVQDVAPVLDQNQVERSQSSSGWRGDLHKVASVPLVLIEEWSRELGCNVLAPQNRHLLMLKLNNRDYSKLRTKEGRI